MIRRLFNRKIIFGLFVFSFIVSFIIMYIGMNMINKTKKVKETDEMSHYDVFTRFYGICKRDITTLENIVFPDVKYGNLFLKGWGPIGNGAINVDGIDVLIAQNEPIQEPISYEPYFNECDETAVVLGDKWIGEIYAKDSKKYIKICGFECLVAGILDSQAIDGKDDRCILLQWKNNGDMADKLAFEYSTDLAFKYLKESKNNDLSDEIFKWAKDTLYDSASEAYIEYDCEWLYSDNLDYFYRTESLFKLINYALLILCFVNCAFLAVVWGRMHTFEYMVKRAMGYKKFKLLISVMTNIILIEIIALIFAIVITFGYEVIFGSLYNWIETLKHGFGFAAFVFAVFGIVLSIIPLSWITKARPADYLKTE